jgi:hypothetical protein
VWDGPGPHNIEQGNQVRVAVPGFRVGTRIPATLIVIWDPEMRGWGFYMDSGAAGVVMIPLEEIEPLRALLVRGPGS